MTRSGVSALVLLAGLALLAKTVILSQQTHNEQPPQTAIRDVPVRPSVHRYETPVRRLGTYPTTFGGRTSLRVRAVNDSKLYRIKAIADDPREVAPREVAVPPAGVDTVVYKKFTIEPSDQVDRAGGRPAKQGRPAAPAFELNEKSAGEANDTGRRRRNLRRNTVSTKRADQKTGAVRATTRHKSSGDVKQPARYQVLAEPVGKPKRRLLVMDSPDWYVPQAELSPAMSARRARIRQCLDFYYDRPLHNIEDSPWSMMHHMIAWGVDSRILVRNREGKTRTVNTIAWLCGNGICDGERLLYVEDGKLRARVGPGLQGHDGQFLAMLAQTRVSRKQVILVDGKKFTTDDLIRQEQLRCRPRSELTFRLIGLSHYLSTDATWKNDQGQRWSIQRLVEEELRQPINGTTCGGTHRLMGFTYSVARRRLEGAPITGPWAKAEMVAKRHQHLAFRMQHRDGSFSSDFFRSDGDWGDIDRKLKTTGHVLEWLIFSARHQDLENKRILAAVDYLCHLLASNRYYDWENGPLGHGVRALALYDERMFGGKPGSRDLEMAEKRPRLQPRTAKRPSSKKPDHRGGLFPRRSRR
jgi:hypothetical protein